MNLLASSEPYTASGTRDSALAVRLPIGARSIASGGAPPAGWEADARTSGSHGWWTETWITADPVPGPNLHDPDQLVTSKEALAISFDLNCGAPALPVATPTSPPARIV